MQLPASRLAVALITDRPKAIVLLVFAVQVLEKVQSCGKKNGRALVAKVQTDLLVFTSDCSAHLTRRRRRKQCATTHRKRAILASATPMALLR